MAYQKEPYRIMAGGLNLLAPSDKPAPGDSLQLQNWRVDQSGQLRSRRGMDFQSGDLAGANGHTLFRFSPNTRYAGVDGLLYGGPGFNAYAALDSGYNGQPLGMVAMQELVWVMNQAKQTWHGGGTGPTYAWTPVAPGVAPAAAALSQDSTVVANFTSGEPWNVTQPDGATGATVLEVLTDTGYVSVAATSQFVLGSGTSFETAMTGATIQIGTFSATILAVIVATQELFVSVPAPALILASTFSISGQQTIFNYANPAELGSPSLFIECSAPVLPATAGSWAAFLTSGLPSGSALLVDGAENDSDVFSIDVWVTDPTALNDITLEVDCNTGAFDTDYYSVTIPASALSQTAFAWSRLEILRDLSGAGVSNTNPAYVALQNDLAAATDPGTIAMLNAALAQLSGDLLGNALYFTRTGTTPGKDWGTVAALRVTLDVNAAVDVQLAQWKVTGGAAGTLSGDYTFYVTFGTPQGHESNPSPPSAPVTLALQPASITNIQRSMDPQVSMRHIYMVGGSLSVPYRIGTIPDNVTTGPFEVTVSEQDAQIEDTTIPVSHDPAPPCLGVIEHLGRLIAFNSQAFPGRYFWTPTGQPYYFPGAGDTEEGNWEDTGEDTDPILAATSHNQTLLFYKSRSVVRLFGDAATSDPELTSSTIGIVGPRALAHAGPLDYVVGAEGVYSFNGEAEVKISLAIDPIFKNEYTAIAPGITVPPLAGDFASACTLEHVNGRLYLSYPAQGGGPTPITLVCDLASGRWYQHYLDPAANGASGFTALYYEGQGRPLMGALSTSAGVAIYALEDETFTDDTNPIPLAWHSRYDDCGMPDVDKVFGELVIVAQTGAAATALTCSLYWANGASSQAIGTINALSRTAFHFALGVNGAGITAKNIAIRIEDSVTTECIIYDCYLYWYIECRHGMAFDTGVIDFGSALAKQLDGLEFDNEAEGPGELTWYLRGDLPSGTIAQLEAGSFAVSTARVVARPPVPITEGRKYRLIGVSTVAFKMHGARARVLEIAEYINGAAGERWTPRPVNYGG